MTITILFWQGSLPYQFLKGLFSSIKWHNPSVGSIKRLTKGLCVAGPTLETGEYLLFFTPPVVTIEAELDCTKFLPLDGGYSRHRPATRNQFKSVCWC